MNLLTPDKVRYLQVTLARKSKSEPCIKDYGEELSADVLGKLCERKSHAQFDEKVLETYQRFLIMRQCLTL